MACIQTIELLASQSDGDLSNGGRDVTPNGGRSLKRVGMGMILLVMVGACFYAGRHSISVETDFGSAETIEMLASPEDCIWNKQTCIYKCNNWGKNKWGIELRNFWSLPEVNSVSFKEGQLYFNKQNTGVCGGVAGGKCPKGTIGGGELSGNIATQVGRFHAEMQKLAGEIVAIDCNRDPDVIAAKAKAAQASADEAAKKAAKDAQAAAEKADKAAKAKAAADAKATADPCPSWCENKAPNSCSWKGCAACLGKPYCEM